MNNINNKCLHCNKNTSTYCEDCYQELITKNAKLQLTLERLKYKMIADRMEQFDDYVIYLINSYLNIIEE